MGMATHGIIAILELNSRSGLSPPALMPVPVLILVNEKTGGEPLLIQAKRPWIQSHKLTLESRGIT